LIDPPFERTDELDAIADLIAKGVARFAGGVYAAWYPVKNAHLVSRFLRRVPKETAKPVLDLRFDSGAEADGEIRLAARQAPRGARRGEAESTLKRVVDKKIMHACGLLVVNPPFGFEAEAAETLAWLKPRLAQG